MLAQAAKCRRLANDTTDELVRRNLLALAEELAAEANCVVGEAITLGRE